LLKSTQAAEFKQQQADIRTSAEQGEPHAHDENSTPFSLRYGSRIRAIGTEKN